MSDYLTCEACGETFDTATEVFAHYHGTCSGKAAYAKARDMTKREAYAALVMVGLVSGGYHDGTTIGTMDSIAEDAFRLADDMLKAGESTPGGPT